MEFNVHSVHDHGNCCHELQVLAENWRWYKIHVSVLGEKRYILLLGQFFAVLWLVFLALRIGLHCQPSVETNNILFNELICWKKPDPVHLLTNNFDSRDFVDRWQSILNQSPKISTEDKLDSGNWSQFKIIQVNILKKMYRDREQDESFWKWDASV